MTTVEELRDQGVRVLDTTLDVDYLSQGLLVRVSIHGAGIFDRKLRFEELGIKADDGELGDWIKPGSKSYAPSFSKRLHSWATQCRQCLSRYALSLESVSALTASTSWKLLLFDAYDQFVERWEELNDLKASILSDVNRSYNHLLREALTFYNEQAERSWDLIQSRYGYGTAIVLPSGMTFGPGDKAAYLDWVEATIRADFPAREAIQTEVFAEYWATSMFTSASVQQNLAREEQARADAAEAALRRSQAEQERWEIEFRREARERAIVEAETRRMQERLAETVDPFAEAMDQLLRELAENITALTEGLERNGSFRGRSLERVERMQELFVVMGGRHLNNDEMHQTLQDLRARAGETPTEEQREAWTNQIVNGLTTLNEQVEAETVIIQRRMQAHTRAGALEL